MKCIYKSLQTFTNLSYNIMYICKYKITLRYKYRQTKLSEKIWNLFSPANGRHDSRICLSTKGGIATKENVEQDLLLEACHSQGLLGEFFPEFFGEIA